MGTINPLVTVLTLLVTLVLVQGKHHEQDQELEVVTTTTNVVDIIDDGIDGNLEKELRSQVGLSDLLLFGSANSRQKCYQKNECQKKGGTCQGEGTCRRRTSRRSKNTKDCYPGCFCCLPILTAEKCIGNNGFCIGTGDYCNGTIKILHNSLEDHCACCVQVPTVEQCNQKSGFCLKTGNRCNGTINNLYNSWEDHCACCVQVPTNEQCTGKNGFCVETGDRCNGTIKILHNSMEDHCTCCVHDHEITPTPLTCPSVTCPTVTCPTVTCPAVTSPAAVTTTGPTISPNLNWLNVGSDQFVRFNKSMKWTDARALCRSHGIDLYEPKDILAVSKYLDDNFRSNVGGKYHWLGAHGNGTHQVWLSGDVVTRNDPWHSNHYTKVGTEYCLYIITLPGVLATVECNWDGNNIDVLCG